MHLRISGSINKNSDVSLHLIIVSSVFHLCICSFHKVPFWYWWCKCQWALVTEHVFGEAVTMYCTVEDILDISVFLLKHSPDMVSESDGFAWNGIWDLSVNSWEMCPIRWGNINDSDRKCWNVLVICYSCFSQISCCSNIQNKHNCKDQSVCIHLVLRKSMTKAIGRIQYI